MVNTLRTVFALVLLVGVLGVVLWLGWLLVTWFLALPAATQTPLAALVGVVSVPVIVYFTTRSLEKRRSRENAIREKKTLVYDTLIRGLMDMLNLNKSKKPMAEKEMLQLFAETTPALITYGSSKVIKAWTAFRETASQNAGPTGDSMKSMLAFEGLLKAMRQDLGHSVLTTSDGDLLALFVTDIKETLAARKRGAPVAPASEG